MSIQRLPGDVAVQIKSSASVTSLNGAVLGLIRNALDAGAARVTVSVDYSRGGCVVEDDGAGISPAEFLPAGGLGKLHHTSKYPPSTDLHGRHGTFLASVAALSLLTVVSLCQGHDSQNALTVHNGKVLRRHMLTSPGQLSTAASHGTRVTICDLFGCMPVRARLRPLSDSVAWDRDWDSLVRAVTALLLAWPADVVVSIQDEISSAKRTLRTERSRRGRGDAPRTARLLTQAGLCEVADPVAWVNVGASVSGVTVSGCVCLVPAASKRLQFLRIGVEPLSEAHHADALYGEINKIFAESNFGAAMDVAGTAGRKTVRGAIDKFVREQRPRKAVDQWPVFCLGIDLDGVVDVDDILDDRRQHLTIILGLIRTMFVEFLKTHKFYDGTTKVYGLHDGDGGTVRRGSSESTRNTPPASPTKKQKTRGPDGLPPSISVRKGSLRPLPRRSKIAQTPSSLFSSWPQTKHAQWSKTELAKTDDGASTATEAPREDNNEEKSSMFGDRAVHAEGGDEHSEEAVCETEGGMEEWDSTAFTSGNMKISRAGLEAAKVIGQVDQKFILIRAPGQSESDAGLMLILVDQHAADERCRVEALLRDYFLPSNSDAPTHSFGNVNTTILERPLQFELAAHERPLLERSRAYFRHWGVTYDVLSSRDGAVSEEALLRVYGLPSSILERCRQEPRLVVDLVRKEIWERSEADLAVPAPVSQSGCKSPWAARFYGCPRGILDLVNSRACRSAIKFNDPLTHDECANLLNRLLRCSFPFQCAHGRPSMVPLLNLGPRESLESQLRGEV